MNVFTFTGNLGKDSVLRYTNDQRPVLNFSVAVKTGFKDSDKDMWVGCSLFGKRAESLQQYLTTGTRVAVSGPCKLRTWQGQDGKDRTNIDVICWEVTLLGSGEPRSNDQGQGSATPPPQQAPRQEPVRDYNGPQHFEDDDIPF